MGTHPRSILLYITRRIFHSVLSLKTLNISAEQAGEYLLSLAGFRRGSHLPAERGDSKD